MKEYWESFWFLRGIIGAITFTTLIPEFMDLSRYEALRGLHWVIIEWDQFAAFLGSVIGEIPFLPKLEGSETTAIIFFCSVVLPIIYPSIRIILFYGLGIGATNDSILLFKSENDILGNPSFFILMILGFGGITVSIYFGEEIFLISHRDRVQYLLDNGPIFISSVSVIAYMVMIVGMLNAFIVSLLYLKGFSRGIIVVLTFISTIEVLYLLEAPWLADMINEIVCSADNATKCS